MHLSREIQDRLDRLDSKIKLGLTIDGILTNEYCSFHDDIREFTVMFASSNQEFSIVLCELLEDDNWGNCLARGLFNDLDRLVTVINLWFDKKEDITEIGKSFKELELYVDFENKNPNGEIERAWKKFKNHFFNNEKFWVWKEWNRRYLEMVDEAKKHSRFKDYFPFRSHYRFKFSKNKALTETWSQDTFIVPTFQNEEGNFYVSYNEIHNGGKFFDTAKAALDFYAEKLEEVAPTK